MDVLHAGKVVLSALVAGSFVGCSKNEPSVSNETVQQAATIAETADLGRAPRGSSPAVAEKEVDAALASPQSAGETEGGLSLSRSGKRPTFSQILRAVRAHPELSEAYAVFKKKNSDPNRDCPFQMTVHGRPLPLDKGRFLACVLYTVENTGSVHGSWSDTFFLVVSEKDGAAQIEGTLSGGSQAEIVTWGAGDLDKDGNTEAWILTSIHVGTECAVGPHYITQYQIVNLEPVFAWSTSFKAGDSYPVADSMDEVDSHVVYEDLNGDGHPDLRVREKTCPWGRRCTTEIYTYLWDKKTDSWIAQ